MMQTILDALGASRYLPHAFALTYDPTIITLYVLGDGIAAVSLLVMGLALFVTRYRTPVISSVTRGLYGSFLFLCSLSHFSDILIMATGVYRLDIVITMAMAGVAATTAALTTREVMGIITLDEI